jgi:hypothetical protein
MNSSSLTHPTPADVWWENEEEMALFNAFNDNLRVSTFLRTNHPRDSFMSMMVGMECFFKYAYALTRFRSINDTKAIDKVLRFLKIKQPKSNQYKCSFLKHDIGLMISELRRRYSNLSHRDIQDFMMSLPPNETTDFKDLSKLSWMAFRYRDGNDVDVQRICTQYIADLHPKFNHIRTTFFGGLP